MRIRRVVVVTAISMIALSTTLGSAFASPDGEHGNGFNCTPGNLGNAEAQHTEHGKDDHGNGDDCAPTTPTVQPSAPLTPTTPSAPAAAVVVAQPSLTG